MNFLIDERISKWLISLEVLRKSDVHAKQSSANSPKLVELSLSLSLSLESGVFFAKLLKALLSKSSINLDDFPTASLDSLKEFSTPTSRLYNWNILSQAFKLISLEIDADLKSLIVAGDKTSVLSFLQQIYERIVSGAAEEKHGEGYFEDFVIFYEFYMSLI